MRRLAKNFILTTAVVSAFFFVDPSSTGATSLQQIYTAEKIYIIDAHKATRNYIDFWSKFRDTVMPDPDKPQDNNPPKEMRKPKPANPKPVPPPDKVEPKPAD